MPNAVPFVTMTPLTPYASDRSAHRTQVQVLRMRQRASRTEALVRAAVLAAALASLAVGLSGALHSGSALVSSCLDAATGVSSVQ